MIEGNYGDAPGRLQLVLKSPISILPQRHCTHSMLNEIN